MASQGPAHTGQIRPWKDVNRSSHRLGSVSLSFVVPDWCFGSLGLLLGAFLNVSGAVFVLHTHKIPLFTANVFENTHVLFPKKMTLFLRERNLEE